jgi:hypothetical protein
VPLLLISLAAGCSREPRSTKDADLIQHFLAHEADFEKLGSMLDEDKDLGVIYNDGSYSGQNAQGNRLEVTLTPGRVAEYREALRRAGIADRDVYSEQREGVHRVYIRVGNLESKSVYILKGYIYSSKELAPLKDSLDVGKWEELKTARGRDCWYKKIKRNWYLYAENMGSYD